jgi:glycosyltransferase involved in cell wall biosynthesis
MALYGALSLLVLCATSPRVPAGLAVRIVSPRHGSTVALAGPQAADLSVIVAYDGGAALAAASAAQLALELSIDGRSGSGATRIGPPLPMQLEFLVPLRWGSHTVRAQLINATTGHAVPGSSSGTSFVDLMPALDSRLLVDNVGGGGGANGTQLRAVAQRPSAAPWSGRASCLRRTARVVLIGNLRMGGQTRLAVEQARRLPKLRLTDGAPAFEVAFLTNSAAGADTAQLLRSWGIAVRNYAITLPQRWIGEGSSVDVAVAALARFATWDALRDAEPSLAEGLSEIVSLLRGADVVSFTNHESVASNDRLLVHAARLAGVPTLLCEPANLWWGSEPTWRGGVDGFVVPSAFAARFWRAHGVAIPMVVINPGVPLPPTTRTRVGAADGAVHVVFVGRLVPQKSPGLFVRMAAVVDAAFRNDARRSVHFDVVGSGWLFDDLVALARHLGISAEAMTFHGALPHDAVMELLATRADVVIHTNLLEETFCMVNVEAMAVGVPIVTFGVGGVSEYLAAGETHSTTVRSPSTAALAAAVIGVVEDGEGRRDQGARAERHVRALHGVGVGNERMVRQYANMYAAMTCDARARAVPEAKSEYMRRGEASVPALFDRARRLLACGDESECAAAGGEAGAFARIRGGDKRGGACAFLSCGIDAINATQSVGLALVHNAGAALLDATGATSASHLPSTASVFEQVDIAGALCAVVAERADLADAAYVAAASAVLLGLHDVASKHYIAAAKARRSPDSFARAAQVLGSGVGRAVEWLAMSPGIFETVKTLGDAEFMHTYATPTRLRHDAMQYRHLAALGAVNGAAWVSVAKAFDALAVTMSGAADCELAQQYIPPTQSTVRKTYGRIVHVTPAPTLAAGALRAASDAAWRDVERAFSSHMVAVLDDVLSADALASLRKYCAESTVFFDIKNGHLGAYLEDGFAPAVALQLAAELRARIPHIIGRLRLTQVWAYKYLGEVGIRPHADEGAVTVNCWLTPDAANLDAATGGLLLYNGAGLPPRGGGDGAFDELALNRDFRSIRAWLAARAAEFGVPLDDLSTHVKYRQNRCVVFRSALFHETVGPVRFMPGLGKSRINLSLMFGTAGTTS